ncbi:hypothetical protein PsYK624_100760 [Phanerochaete sordida]|uniref:Uncharacterized protein n=1 Tax=Phanerochaete sordida TaxID=48140 RepID=A0A9P3LFV2_9APHY|nr:hypothetical protein PsYK624_100760 [Phanerochaete sordida]
MAVAFASAPTLDPQHRAMPGLSDESKDLPPIPSTSMAAAEDGSNRPGLFKRVTTKLRSPTQSWAHSASNPNPLLPVAEDAAEEPASKHKRKFSFRMPSLPAPQAVARPPATLENAWTSPEQREAALRACGLIPAQPKPLRDLHGYRLPLSEQEDHLDREWALLPADGERMTADGESEAERIKEAWLKKNTDAAPPPPAPPARSDSLLTRIRSLSPSPVDAPVQPSSPPKSPPRTRRQSPQPPPPAPAAAPRTHERKESMKPDFSKDPNVARLMQAMQGYKPENYRPPPRRKPTMPNSTQRYESDSDSDAGSN